MRKNHLDFNDIFILESYLYREDREIIEMFNIPSIEDITISSRIQYLTKEEYLTTDPTDSSRLITSLKGIDIIDQIKLSDNKMSARLVIMDLSKTSEESFEEWWKTYPTTGTWTTDDGSHKFVSSRNLKNLTKAKAKVIYLKLLNQGLIHEELLGSLKYEIKLKKLDSIKKNANQMEYFKGMESYLNQQVYLLYMDLYKSNRKFIEDEIKSSKKNVKDI